MGLNADIVENANRIQRTSATVSGLENMAESFSNSIESLPKEIVDIKKFIEYCVDTGELPSFSTTSGNQTKPSYSLNEENKPIIIKVPSRSSIEKYNGMCIIFDRLIN